MPLLRWIRPLALALVCLVALPAASALAARKGAVRPVITSVGPASLSVGDTLTIRGRNFLAGAKRNTVTFKGDRGRAISVKAGQATRTVIKVVVPASLDVIEPTRFRVRVRARTSSRGYTAPKRSVLIGPIADALDDAAGCAAGDVADALGDLAGLDGLGNAVDDLLAPAGCDDAADPGAAPGAGADGTDATDPGDDAPADPGGAPDPWDLPTA